MISQLLLTSTSKTSIGYFFCRYDDSESTVARTIIGSIARQLLSGLPHESYAKLDKELQDSKPDIQAIFEILKATLIQGCQYIVIVDGLNDCEDTEAQQTIEILDSLLNLGDLQIKIYYSYRANSIVWPQTAWPLYRVAIRCADVESDINQYIQISLESRIKHDILQVGSPYVASAIKQALMEGAQGMSVSATILCVEFVRLQLLGSSGWCFRSTIYANSGLMTPS